jgi:hypothetical protein
MPQLQENPATLGMDRISDTPPSGALTLRIDAGRLAIAVAADRDRRRLGNDEAAVRRALGIVFDHHVARNVARIGAHPCQRRHHDTMEGPSSNGEKSVVIGIFPFFRLAIKRTAAGGRDHHAPHRPSPAAPSYCDGGGPLKRRHHVFRLGPMCVVWANFGVQNRAVLSDQIAGRHR